MDMNMLAEDVEKALELLPPDFVKTMLHGVRTHAPVLMSVVPKLVPLLAPHVNAGILEKQTGLLSTDEIGQCLLPVLQRYMMRHATP